VVEVVDASSEPVEGMAALLRCDTFGELPAGGPQRLAAVKAAVASDDRKKVQQRRADHLLAEGIRQVRDI